MKKSLWSQVDRWLVRQLNLRMDADAWSLVGHMAARRSGPWVQSVGVEPSRWADEFVPWHGLTYLRQWDRIPRITGDLAGGRVKGPTGVDAWLTSESFQADREGVFDLISRQAIPSVEQPLTYDGALEAVRGDALAWQSSHALCFVAAEAGDSPAARAFLDMVVRFTQGHPLDDFVASARQAIQLMDEPPRLSAWLDEIQESKLASLRGRPLG